MRIIFNTVSILVAFSALSLSGCLKFEREKNPPPDFKIEELKMPDFDIFASLRSCKKPEAEQADLQAASENQIDVKAEVVTQDEETVDCDGKVLSKKLATIHSFDAVVKIEKESSLTEPVDYIEIENQRTCVKQNVSAISSDLEPDTIKIENNEGNEIEIPKFGPKATTIGDLRLPLSQTDIQLPTFGTNVEDGKNVLRITYFGKCRKFQEATETEPKRCIEGEQIGKKIVLLQVETKRTKLEGVKQVVQCKEAPPAEDTTPAPATENN